MHLLVNLTLAPVRALVLSILLMSVGAASAQTSSNALVAAARPAPDAESAGQALAADLRSSRPEKNTQINAALRIRVGGEWRRSVPITFRIVLGVTNWQTIYETSPADAEPAERFIAVHTPGQPNEYWLALAGRGGQPLPEPQRVSAEQSFIPLGGTDYWLIDLGRDFLHWPGQRVLRHESRRTRRCVVLESTPPAHWRSGYGRVVTWVDEESGGIIDAEAYDREGRLLKEFTVRSLKKIEGVYQVKDMDIRSVTNKSLTRLEFELTAR